MKIAFVVNDIATERAGFSTVHLAFTAHRMGHDVYMMGIGDLASIPTAIWEGGPEKQRTRSISRLKCF